MEVLSMIEKEPIPLLAEADRHTKKVKNWDDLNGENKEVIMEQVDDIMEDQREAMETNQTLEEGVSFKDKLMRNKGSHKPAQLVVEIEFQDQDVKIGTENDMPTIRFSDRVKGILACSMDCSVIVKLLGRTIGYKVLQNRIMALWKPSSELRITDLDNGYFLVNLENHKDRVNALIKGPWTVLGH